jgi:hypothetical protein
MDQEAMSVLTDLDFMKHDFYYLCGHENFSFYTLYF